MHIRAAKIAGLLLFGLFAWVLLIRLTDTAHALPMRESIAPAADSDLDPTFGNAGVVTRAIPGSFGQIEALPDGRVLALFTKTRDPDDIASRTIVQLMRFNNNGSLDTSFGEKGALPLLNLNPNECLQDALGPSYFWLQPDGKILLLYECGILQRVLFNGTPDASFGQSGKISGLVPGLYGDKLLAFAPSGKIYLGSRGEPYGYWRVKRFFGNGALDSGFALSGTLRGCTDCSPVHSSASSYSKYLSSVMPLQNGGFILGHSESWSFQGGTGYYACYIDVYPPNGRNPNRLPASPNLCFGGVSDGYGRLYTAGPCTYCTTRLNSDGSVDLTYGSSGTISSTLGMNIELRQHDGKIICNGWSSTPCTDGTPYPPNEHIRLARVDDLGHLDTNFGNNGYFTFTMSAALLEDPTPPIIYRTRSAAADIEFNGRIVVAGYYEVPDPCSTPFCPMTSHIFPVMLRLKGTRVPIENHYLPLITQTSTQAP